MERKKSRINLILLRVRLQYRLYIDATVIQDTTNQEPPKSYASHLQCINCCKGRAQSTDVSTSDAYCYSRYEHAAKPYELLHRLGHALSRSEGEHEHPTPSGDDATAAGAGDHHGQDRDVGVYSVAPLCEPKEEEAAERVSDAGEESLSKAYTEGPPDDCGEVLGEPVEEIPDLIPPSLVGLLRVAFCPWLRPCALSVTWGAIRRAGLGVPDDFAVSAPGFVVVPGSPTSPGLGSLHAAFDVDRLLAGWCVEGAHGCGGALQRCAHTRRDRERDCGGAVNPDCALGTVDFDVG